MKHASPKYCYFLCLFFLMATGGCVSLSPSDLATADYGFYPDDYQGEIKLRMGKTLFDPYSAHYQMGSPYRAGSKLGLIYGGGWRFGYAVDVLVNAKNRFGAYVGNKSYTFFFYKGEMHEVRNFHMFRRVPERV